MNASVRVLVASAVAIGAVGGWWLASKPGTTVAPRTADQAAAPRIGIALPDATPKAGAMVADEDRVDPMQAYVALRDDVNPKERLRLIEDWSRARAPGASLDLLTQAMVDPDEQVRARAQDLFERGLSADTRLHHETLATPSQ